MARATRYWVVERNADGDSVGDFHSYRSTIEAYRAARVQRLNPQDPTAAIVEVGRIVNFEEANEFTQVLRVSKVVR